jgi:nitric oxide reductase subunit B
MSPRKGNDGNHGHSEQLSPRWRHAVVVTFVVGFAVLVLLTFKAYQNAPPIPARVIDIGRSRLHR